MSRRSFIGMSAAAVSTMLAGRVPSYAEEAAYDVAVVGAGAVGCLTARELSRYDLSVCVLEKDLDIASSTTRANSGIVHVGFDPKPGTLKAYYNVRGSHLYPELQADLGFAYFKNGALVLAFTEDDLETLEALRERGMLNGADETTLLSSEELHGIEPAVSSEAIAALYAPTSGICDPYGLTYGAAENACANGVEFRFASRVEGIAARDGLFELEISDGSRITARCVVNAAGLFADDINNMVSASKLEIKPRRGEYHLYKNTVHPFNATVFQAPSDKGKGVLVSPVAFGNLIVGPNSEWQQSKTDVSTTAQGLADVLAAGARTWPELADIDCVISNFAGLRAISAEGDFVIGEAPDVPGFFNAACIDSPGLASAPAIAQDLAKWASEYLGAAENPDFNPVRAPAPLISMMDDLSREALANENPLYGRFVCKCCNVTEGEIVETLHRALPVLSLDALKWRTGCFMGPCQGGRCMANILGIVCRELGIGPNEICKRNEGSWLVDSANAEGFPDVEAQDYPTSFEKPRAAYRIPGSRPAGVYSAYGLSELMALDECVPGTKAVVWGDTRQAADCAAQLEGRGVSVVRLGGEASILEVVGEGRVSLVRCENEGEQVEIPCDLLVVARDLQVDDD